MNWALRLALFTSLGELGYTVFGNENPAIQVSLVSLCAGMWLTLALQAVQSFWEKVQRD